MKHQICFPDTYDAVFRHANNELAVATRSGEPIKHLLVILGPPIAVPRLTVLERIFQSVLMAPMSCLNRRFGVFGSFLNFYDSKVWLLPSLDNYTALAHKKERQDLVDRLQNVAAAHSVRILILSGGMRAAAVGCFYASRDLRVAAEHDHRFMVNVVSSPMVNKPLPHRPADFVASRNKRHYFDPDTDETLINMFDKNPDTITINSHLDSEHSNHAASGGHVIMASRNYLILAENSSKNNNHNQTTATSVMMPPLLDEVSGFSGPDGIRKGDMRAGKKHKAAGNQHGKGNDGSLDLCICVEKDRGDPDGHTTSYGMIVPSLIYPPLI